MLGWEFPPYISGGLGTACYGLTRAMDQLGIPVTFVLPKAPTLRFGAKASGSGHNPHKFSNVKIRTIASALRPYGVIEESGGRVFGCGESYSERGRQKAAPAVDAAGGEQGHEHYGGDLHSQVNDFASKASDIAAAEDFDIVHAHDWMTYPAGVAVAQQAKKPLIVHVHSTEHDRSGLNVNQMVYEIERFGMHAANKVITVSNYTKNIITTRYGVSPHKVLVVYNGVDCKPSRCNTGRFRRANDDKMVLFLGRVTMQKGPEYFIYSAKRVLEKMPNVKFVMAGAGDMLHRMIELAAFLGIGHKVFFTRFLRGDDVRKAYEMADLYVMPSVSEPFGIAPLEALQNGVPVLISRQSGISERLRNALKVDFWDVDEMANKIVGVLRHNVLQKTLAENGRGEIPYFSWYDTAGQINSIYEQSIA